MTGSTRTTAPSYSGEAGKREAEKQDGGCGCGGHGPRVDEREEVLSEGRENLGLRAATSETPATGGCGCGSHS